MRDGSRGRAWGPVVVVAAVLLCAVGTAQAAPPPVLEVVPPTIDQAALRITARLRNRGATPLRAADVIVRYAVTGVTRGARPAIAANRGLVAGVSIAPGATADVGSFVLPDRDAALAYENVTIQIRVEPAEPGRFEVAEGSFPHRWRESTLVVTAESLRSVVAACSITLDNAVGGGGGASFIRLEAGARVHELKLELPRSCTGAAPPGAGAAGSDAGGIVVAGLSSAPRPGQPLFAIRDGLLVIRVELGARRADELRAVTPSGRGAAGTGIAVADVRPFVVEVGLTPAVSIDGRRLSYGRLPAVTVFPVSAAPTGPAPFARPILDQAVRTCIRDPLSRHLRGLFDRTDVRATVEELLAAVLAPYPVRFVRGVVGRGNTIALTWV